MSDATPTAENEAMLKQVQAILDEVEAVRAAVASSRSRRRWLLLGFVIFVAVFSGLFYTTANRLKSEENVDLLIKTAQERFELSKESYMAEVQTLVDNASPTLTKAFYAQTKKDMPRYTEAFQKERDKLLADMESKLTEQVNDHYANAIKRHEEVLRAEFPQFAEEETTALMIANMQVALESLLKKHYGDEMREELLAMFDTWEAFPAADPPKSGEPALEDQFFRYLLRIVTLRAAENNPLPEEQAENAGG